ncbi:hypothetical protein [Nocardia niwae]|uniref:hypothetical protein n=1 Tax=Nocardia niwae TaxID=626084 RepID=UPI0033D879BD
MRVTVVPPAAEPALGLIAFRVGAGAQVQSKSRWPVASIGAERDVVDWLPSYGAMQASTSAGFSGTTPLPVLAVQLVWFTASVLVGLVAFHLRTRSALKATMPIGEPGQPAKQ